MISFHQKVKPIVFILLLILICSNLKAQQSGFSPNRTYSQDSLKIWTTDIFDEMSKSHPGFYRYTSKERFDFLIDSTNQTIKNSLTELEYYRKLKPLIAQIGCLHTGISLSKAYQDYLNVSQSMLPLAIFINSNGVVLVSNSYASDANIPIGGEILSINGKPMHSIINKLLRAIPSDGYNQTEKVLLLNHRFSFWYQTIIEVNEKFSIEIANNGKIKTYEVKGVSKDIFPSLESIIYGNGKTLEFEILDNIGILKIHSFAKTEVKEDSQNFKKFIKEVFQEIKTKDIKELILDVRYNTGGTDSNAVLLASYFFDKPFRYWDKIEVTEAIANDVKGLDKLFYKKPEKNVELYQWKKTWVTKEFDFYEEQKPAKHSFKGNLYILTNGMCLSSCADFTAILSHNKKAVVVGQETGGGYQGNTSGMMPEVSIPTGLRLTIPLQKYTNAVDLTKNFGSGTIPDHIVAPDLKDWIEKKDVEMEYTLELINKERAK
ncbi:S41 family peptidase [Mariniflexile sp. HMF6888]|uniref:S41 family peptidase n=1 Tax=Mariniflexile sp. HMF6888 TaxID=3373086 RepID=UPI0037A9B58B